MHTIRWSYTLARTLCFIALLGSFVGGADRLAAQARFDLQIRGARVLDGTGNPWFAADIGIAGGRITAIGDLDPAEAADIVDASGLYVAPGFIDVHSHAGPGLATHELSAAVPLLMQGITTVLVNPDGGGPTDLERQRRELLEHGLGVNVALMVPHGSVRRDVLGMDDRAPTEVELDAMRTLVSKGMEAGAYGLSSGPFYAPGSFARTEELIELAKVASAFGGAYSSHIRDEADYSIGVVAAVDEVIAVAYEAQLPGVVTHIKALGPRVWGFSGALVQRIERARAQGIEVYADQYPYEASSTGLSAALVPRWAQVGGQDSLNQRLGKSETRGRIRLEMIDNLERRGGAERITIGRHAADPSAEGRTLAELAADRELDPVDAAIELIQDGGAGIISFNMFEPDIRTLMAQPWTMTASDGGLVPLGSGLPHPRGYGTFPRRLRRYVLEQQVTDLATAVRSMTSLPATVFRLNERGVLRVGAIADIIVFDLDRVADRATYDEPHQLAEGMVHVLVNGAFAVQENQPTGALHGTVLDRQR